MDFNDCDKMEYKMMRKRDIEPSPWNPRNDVDKAALEALKTSIKGSNLVEPIRVRPNPNKTGKYLLTFGWRRWHAHNDEDEIPCIVCDETEIDAKIAGLVENSIRSDLSDVDNEKFITEVYNEGIESGKWKNQSEMAKKTGLTTQQISTNIQAEKDRRELNIRDHEKLSTSDFKESLPLKNQPEVRKPLLEKRASGKLKGDGHIVHKTSKKLASQPEHVALAYLKKSNLSGSKDTTVKSTDGFPEKTNQTELNAAPFNALLEKDKKFLNRSKFLEYNKETLLGELQRFFRYITVMNSADISSIEPSDYKQSITGFIRSIKEKCSELLQNM